MKRSLRVRGVAASLPATLAGALLPVLLGLGCGYAVDQQAGGVDVEFEHARAEYENAHYFDAVIAFTDFIREHPGSVLVDQAIYYRGQSHFEQKDWAMAAADFERLVRDFPESRFACDAEIALADTYWKQSRKPPYDQEETRQALAQYRRFLNRCPDHPRAAEAPAKITEARERLADKLLSSAELYQKLGHDDSAVIYYGLVIDEYGDLPEAVTAHRERLALLVELDRGDEARADLDWLIDNGLADKDLRHRFGNLLEGDGHGDP